MEKKLKAYPEWCCSWCGNKYQKRKSFSISGTSSYHRGTCDFCGDETAVTEPRDFGYPTFPGHKKPFDGGPIPLIHTHL